MDKSDSINVYDSTAKANTIENCNGNTISTKPCSSPPKSNISISIAAKSKISIGRICYLENTDKGEVNSIVKFFNNNDIIYNYDQCNIGEIYNMLAESPKMINVLNDCSTTIENILFCFDINGQYICTHHDIHFSRHVIVLRS